MNIKKYHVKQLTNKELCTIGGGFCLPELILDFLEVYKVKFAAGFEGKALLSELPLYQGPKLSAWLTPYGFPKLHFTLLGDTTGEVKFEGPHADIVKYMQAYGKIGVTEFKIKNEKLDGSGQAIVDAVWRSGSNTHSTSLPLVLSAITSSRELINGLTAYVLGGTHKMPEIKPNDVHPAIKAWAEEEEKLKQQGSKKSMFEGGGFIGNSTNFISTTALPTTFNYIESDTSPLKQLNIFPEAKAYLEAFRDWAVKRKKREQCEKYPRYKGPALSGLLEMNGFPNLSFTLLGEGDGVMEYRGSVKDVSGYIETMKKRMPKPEDLEFIIIHDTFDGKIRSTRGVWKHKGHIEDSPSLVLRGSMLPGHASRQHITSQIQKLLSYTFGDTDDASGLDSSLFCTNVKEAFKEELTTNNTPYIEETKSNFYHQMLGSEDCTQQPAASTLKDGIYFKNNELQIGSNAGGRLGGDVICLPMPQKKELLVGSVQQIDQNLEAFSDSTKTKNHYKVLKEGDNYKVIQWLTQKAEPLRSIYAGLLKVTGKKIDKSIAEKIMNHELKISYQKPAGKPMPIDPLTIERHLTLALFQHYGGSKNTSKSTLEESYKLKTDAQLPTETKNPLAKKTHIPQPKPIINEPNYGDQPILNPNFIKDYCEKGDLIYIGKALQNKVKEEVKDPMTHSSGAVSFRVNELDEYLIGPKNIIQKHMQTWALNEKGAPHFKVLSEEKTFLKVRWIYNGSPQLPPYRQGTWDTLQTFLDAKKSSLTAGIKKGAKNKKK